MSLYKNIFLVDDDADDHLFFTTAINVIDKSIKCSVASNGLEALTKLNALEMLPDIIFLDINMPVMNGFEFINKLKAEKSLRGIPVVVLSTSDKEADRMYKLGAIAVLTKTTSIPLLTLKIEPMLYSGYPVTFPTDSPVHYN